jgi:hypothetical protein
VNISSTTESSGTTVITCAAHTFDGAPVVAEFFGHILAPDSGTLTVCLFESTTQITRAKVVCKNDYNVGLAPWILWLSTRESNQRQQQQ